MTRLEMMGQRISTKKETHPSQHLEQFVYPPSGRHNPVVSDATVYQSFFLTVGFFFVRSDPRPLYHKLLVHVKTVLAILIFSFAIALAAHGAIDGLWNGTWPQITYTSLASGKRCSNAATER